jgi:hypothetical protein
MVLAQPEAWKSPQASPEPQPQQVVMRKANAHLSVQPLVQMQALKSP